MIAEFFTQIGSVITGMLGAMTSATEGVIPLFWNVTDSKFTILGLLLVLAVGGGIVYWAFRLIRGLIYRGGSKA